MITDGTVGRRDPEEEFFRLTFLAIKMVYIERDPEFSIEVDPKKLYK
jgi:hypothetical protein